MSRIGRQSITIPDQVTVTATDTSVLIKGVKGELTVTLPAKIKVQVADGLVMVTRQNEQKSTKAAHGLVRSLIHNATQGVTQGFSKTLKLVGTGYRVQAKGQNLSLAVGFSHTIDVETVPGVSFKVEGNDTIVVSGIDKHMVGQVSANIRKVRPPEPYKGKGIRYENEYVKIKPGKTAAA
ncbi:50S ribosomal protein L6 [Patescibacteria group bacterium]|nr:50S ribosomal protein L6 [Patescibacteria group bacterium]